MFKYYFILSSLTFLAFVTTWAIGLTNIIPTLVSGLTLLIVLTIFACVETWKSHRKAFVPYTANHLH